MAAARERNKREVAELLAQMAGGAYGASLGADGTFDIGGIAENLIRESAARQQEQLKSVYGETFFEEKVSELRTGLGSHG